MGLRTQKTCRDSPKTQRIDKTGNTKNNQEKDRTTATTIKASKSSEEKHILKQLNKYELTTRFRGGNTKLFAKTWKKLTSDKYILHIITNGLRLDFKEFPKNRQYQFRTLKNDELGIVETEIDKLLRKQVICESKKERNDYLSNVFTRNKKDGGKRMISNLKQFNTYLTYR